MSVHLKLSSNRSNRQGVAVVEAALLLPLILIVAMGIIEVGQLIIVKQNLINASRLGARQAARDSTQSTVDVTATVMDYFSGIFPHLDSLELQIAARVKVFDKDGNELTGIQLANIPSGEKLAVQVEFDFSAVQWTGAIQYWDLKLDPITSYSRRE